MTVPDSLVCSLRPLPFGWLHEPGRDGKSELAAQILPDLRKLGVVVRDDINNINPPPPEHKHTYRLRTHARMRMCLALKT